MARIAWLGFLTGVLFAVAGCDLTGKLGIPTPKDAVSPDAASSDVAGCVPQCADRECGSDGCGGSCGRCAEGRVCDPSNGKCGTCQPMCSGRVCGDDACGGTCGTCAVGSRCDSTTGTCRTCTPACGTATCGDDGCGGTCGTCREDEACNPLKRICIAKCQPDCTNKECGDDGCGGNCGSCPSGGACVSGICMPGASDVIEPVDPGPVADVPPVDHAPVDHAPVDHAPVDVTYPDPTPADLEPFDNVPWDACVPDCRDRYCGSDGCGGSCGECFDGLYCQEGSCIGLPDQDRVTGAPCTIDDQCWTAQCLTTEFLQLLNPNLELPGGMCSMIGCFDDSECGPGGRCVNASAVSADFPNLCLQECFSDADCGREGFGCPDLGTEDSAGNRIQGCLPLTLVQLLLCDNGECSSSPRNPYCPETCP